MGTFKIIHFKPKYSVINVVHTTAVPQIVHMDANRISGSLQKYPESGCNNQNYALSQKGQSLLRKPNEGIEKSKKLGRCGRQNMLR